MSKDQSKEPTHKSSNTHYHTNKSIFFSFNLISFYFFSLFSLFHFRGISAGLFFLWVTHQWFVVVVVSSNTPPKLRKTKRPCEIQWTDYYHIVNVIIWAVENYNYETKKKCSKDLKRFIDFHCKTKNLKNTHAHTFYSVVPQIKHGKAHQKNINIINLTASST